jgi:transcriptional regulator with XRE-family HTH domain
MQDFKTIPQPVQTAMARGAQPVKALREWRGLTQDALADRSCLAISQVQRAERGGEIPVAAMRLIARALGVPETVLNH